MDFTLSKYGELCETIRASGYRSVGFSHFLAQEKGFTNDPLIILRHDVDAVPSNALRMARIESEFNLTGNYFFRRSTFFPEIASAIQDMGHETGYHYECLSSTRGDYEKAIRLFEEVLEEFRKHVKISSISMHGRTTSPYNNLDLWKRYDFRKFGLIGEPYLSLDYNRFSYFSDTGRTWDANRYNLRDRVQTISSRSLNTTNDLIRLIHTRELNRIILLVHPERWSMNLLYHTGFLLWDTAINTAKLFLKHILKHK